MAHACNLPLAWAELWVQGQPGQVGTWVTESDILVRETNSKQGKREDEAVPGRGMAWSLRRCGVYTRNRALVSATFLEHISPVIMNHEWAGDVTDWKSTDMLTS